MIKGIKIIIHYNMQNSSRYIYLCDENHLKKKSLEDNIYFTLRDIFWNGYTSDIIYEANDLNYELTGGIHFEGRTHDFTYVNVLSNKSYVSRLAKWLNKINKYYFDIVESENVYNEKYMKFEDWWSQFEELRKKIIDIHISLSEKHTK